jgi:hypothetical protein
MQFKGKEVKELTLKELQAADWELEGVETNYIESLKHPKFEKIKPRVEMNPSFKALRDEIKQEMKKKEI